MNSYILLPQKQVHINNIPPRLMWNNDEPDWTSTSSGYCGETSILSAGLLFGQYVPMYFVRQFLADYFAQEHYWTKEHHARKELRDDWEAYFGNSWKDTTEHDHRKYLTTCKDEGKTPLSEREWFKRNGQYYCQVLLQIGPKSKPSFAITNHVLECLGFLFENYQPEVQNTYDAFIPWIKRNVVKGHSVVIGVQDFMAGSNDPNYDHIVSVIGWGSNNDLNEEKTRYYHDDAIVFSDHGLMVSGRQPHGGSIPYYYKYPMTTQNSTKETGGWLDDGGCQDPDNPAFDFILDLGASRRIQDGKKRHVCNTYQLAKKTPKEGKAEGNAGLALHGVLREGQPENIAIRIDTGYYQIPVITTVQATNGEMPLAKNELTHKVSISGLDTKLEHDVWLFTAESTDKIHAIAHASPKNYHKYGKIHSVLPKGKATFSFEHVAYAHIAVFVRCIPKG